MVRAEERDMSHDSEVQLRSDEVKVCKITDENDGDEMDEKAKIWFERYSIGIACLH